MNKIETVP